MKRTSIVSVVFLASMLVLLSGKMDLFAQNSAVTPVPGMTEHKGMRNVAYFEAGPYWEFALLEKELHAALARRGILDKMAFPDSLRISPGWEEGRDVYLSEARKLMNNPEVDCIISMGTEATKALLAVNNGVTPIISIDVADPVGAGIINGDTGSRAANLTIQFTPDKWNKVFVLFHRALPFQRLGIMYHDSPEGLSYSNVNEAREVARERGFALIEYPGLDKEESPAACAKGVETLLGEHIDAFYISALNCFDWTQANPQPLFDELHERGIMTFARDGSVHVRRGALMGLSTLDYAPLGDFYADRMGRLLHLLPENTPAVREQYRPKITLNLVTASNLHIDFPLVLLISADEIFDSLLADVRNATVVP